MHPYIHEYIYSFNHAYPLTYKQTCVYTHIHTYIHTYIHAYIHTYIHTYIHAYIHTYIHTYIHEYIHTFIHTYIHTYILRVWTPLKMGNSISFFCFTIMRNCGQEEKKHFYMPAASAPGNTRSSTEDCCIYSPVKVYETSKEISQEFHRGLLLIFLNQNVYVIEHRCCSIDNISETK